MDNLEPELRELLNKHGLETRENLINDIINLVNEKCEDSLKAEQSLKESEELFKILFDSSVDAIMFGEPPSQYFISANKATLDMFQIKDIEEFTSLNPWVLSPKMQPDGSYSQERGKKEIQKALINGSNYYEWIHKRKNGQEFPATVLLTKVILGNRTLLQANVRDITEQKQAEQALKESEENTRYILKHNPNAIAVFDRDMNILLTSDRFLKDYNVKAKEIIGRNHYEVFPDIPERWKKIHQRALKGEVLRNDDDYFVRTDGSITYTRWECRPWYYSNGDIGGMIAYTEVITDRKKAEQALKESEERFNLALEAINDGIWDWNLAEDIVFFDNRYYTLAGYKPYEFPQAFEEWEKRVHPDDIDNAMEKINDHIEGRTEKFSVRFRFLRKDKKWMWIHARGKTIIKDSSGNPVRMIGTHTDIDNLVEYEQQLELYNKIGLILKDPLSFIDKDYKYHTVNDAYSKFFDIPIHEIIGMKSEDIHGKETFEKIIKPELEKCFSGETVNYSRWFEIPTHGKRYMDINYFPQFSKYGEVIGVICHAHDLTEEKILQDIIEKEEKNWQDSFNSLKDIMMIIGNDFTIEKINDSGLKYLDLPKEEVIGRKCHELFYQRNKPMDICPYMKVMKSKSNESTLWHNKKDGKHFSITSSPILDENGNISKLVDLLVDITHLKDIENELRAVNETKDKFFSIISHDLRSPLVGIMSLSEEFVRSRNNMSINDMIEIVEAINYTSSELYKLLDNLLQWSQINSGNIEFNPMRLKLKGFVDEVYILMKKQLEQKKIELNINIPEKKKVFVDNNMAQLIFRNIISNAIKFSNIGGQIDVVATQKSEDFIEIKIIDNGIGIPEEKKKNLFKIDKITSSVGTAGERGSGLGLILCKEFIEKHGCTIWLESEVGHGSTFYFTLPIK